MIFSLISSLSLRRTVNIFSSNLLHKTELSYVSNKTFSESYTFDDPGRSLSILNCNFVFIQGYGIRFKGNTMIISDSNFFSCQNTDETLAGAIQADCSVLNIFSTCLARCYSKLGAHDIYIHASKNSSIKESCVYNTTGSSGTIGTIVFTGSENNFLVDLNTTKNSIQTNGVFFELVDNFHIEAKYCIVENNTAQSLINLFKTQKQLQKKVKIFTSLILNNSLSTQIISVTTSTKLSGYSVFISESLFSGNKLFEPLIISSAAFTVNIQKCKFDGPAIDMFNYSPSTLKSDSWETDYDSIQTIQIRPVECKVFSQEDPNQRKKREILKKIGIGIALTIACSIILGLGIYLRYKFKHERITYQKWVQENSAINDINNTRVI